MTIPVHTDGSIHIDRAYITDQLADFKKAASSFSKSRTWTIFFGVTTGLCVMASIGAITAFAVSPVLSSHVWTVVGTSAAVDGVGIILFAITAVKAVRNHREKEDLRTGFKEYNVSEIVIGILFGEADRPGYQACCNYVLGIKEEDMPLFLSHLDGAVRLRKGHAAAYFVNAIPDFIRERPSWKEELANAGFDESLLQRLADFHDL